MNLKALAKDVPNVPKEDLVSEMETKKVLIPSHPRGIVFLFHACLQRLPWMPSFTTWIEFALDCQSGHW